MELGVGCSHIWGGYWHVSDRKAWCFGYLGEESHSFSCQCPAKLVCSTKYWTWRNCSILQWNSGLFRFVEADTVMEGVWKWNHVLFGADIYKVSVLQTWQHWKTTCAWTKLQEFYQLGSLQSHIWTGRHTLREIGHHWKYEIWSPGKIISFSNKVMNYVLHDVLPL